MCVIIVFLLIFILTVFKNLHGHLLLVCCLSYLFLILYFVNRIFPYIKFSIDNHPGIMSVGKYSFGIYVFHQWIIWNITRWHGTSSLMNEHYVIFPLILFITVFAISYYLSVFLCKTKVGRYLLL